MKIKYSYYGLRRVLVAACVVAGLSFEASAITPANTNSIPAVYQVLNWLDSLPSRASNRVVMGQHLSHAAKDSSYGFSQYVDPLYTNTAEWVGIIGLDYGNDATPAALSNANDIIIDYWNNGGLVALEMHPDNPWTGNNSWDLTDRNLLELITTTTAVHNTWMNYLDVIADGLQELEDEGVAVLWRPYHENNFRGAFWWDMGAVLNDHPSQGIPVWIDMWVQMYDYFTETKGLDNLIWVFAAANHDHTGWNDVDTCYPGDAYVDMVGIDVYSDSVTITGDGYNKMLALGKPFALTEYGPGTSDGSYDTRQMIQNVRNNYPAVTYALWWHSWTDNDKAIVDNQYADQFMDDSWVINRDEIDWQTVSNTAPTVSAGADLQASWPSYQVTLGGSVSDDGLPTNGTLTIQWTKQSGPGTVSFADATSPTSTVTVGSPGNYTLRLTASDGIYTNSDDMIIQAFSPPQPTLLLSPQLLTPAVAEGLTPDNDSFTIANGGTGTVNYTLSESVSWLSITPTSGSSTGESDSITVQYSASGLTEGSYTGVITVTSAEATNSPQEVTVQLTIQSPLPGGLRAYDGFEEYSAGSLGGGSGGSGWSTGWTNNEGDILVLESATYGSMSYSHPASGIEADGGSRFIRGTSGIRSRSWRPLSEPVVYNFDNATNIYISYLIRENTNGPDNTAYLYADSLGNDDGYLYRAGAYNASHRLQSTNWQPLVVGDTYLVVLKIWKNSSYGGWSGVEAWVNPTSSVSEQAEQHLLLSDFSAAEDINGIKFKLWDQQASYDFDEVRVGNAWTDVVPTGGADPDSDNDGMLDSWEQQHFGDTTTATTNTDSDADGMLDWQEYITGTQPTNSGSYFDVQGLDSAGGNAVSWWAITGRTYNIYWSTNIIQTPFSILTNLTAPQDGMLTFTDVVHQLEQQLYYRIEAAQP